MFGGRQIQGAGRHTDARNVHYPLFPLRFVFKSILTISFDFVDARAYPLAERHAPAPAGQVLCWAMPQIHFCDSSVPDVGIALTDIRLCTAALLFTGASDFDGSR